MSPASVPVLTIDGPSASGKGTISRVLAQRLGWHYLDSGALYRAVGLAALRAGVDAEDRAALEALAQRVELRFELRGDTEPELYIDGVPAGEALRSEACAAMASTVAGLPGVRAALLAQQRAFRRAPGLVADGRDMGTVVFPDADYKVFLTASAEERARRRYKQLREKGIDVSIPALLRELVARDERDRNREVAPLRPAGSALVLDSTGLDADAVVARVLAFMGH